MYSEYMNGKLRINQAFTESPIHFFIPAVVAENTMKSMLILFPHPTQLKHLVDSCKCISV